jgi:four helix bundle protein
MEKDLADRLFNFVIEVLKYLRTIKDDYESRVLKHQLVKSCTSVGANYEESQGASSRSDFNHKVKISLKEIRETNYWLRIFQTLELGDIDECTRLYNESEELKKILGAISSKVAKSINK